MRDKIALWIAIHLPRRIRYWATMQMIGVAIKSNPSPNVPAISLGYILKRIEDPNTMVRETLHNLEELGARSER